MLRAFGALVFYRRGLSSPSLAKGCPLGRGSGIICPCGAMDTGLRRYDDIKINKK